MHPSFPTPRSRALRALPFVLAGFAAVGAAQEGPLPPRLSDTGLFASVPEHRPAADLVPYEVSVPFWSDGAGKRRWIRVPEGTAVRFSRDWPWLFPLGTTFVKSFVLRDAGDRRLVETRVLRRAAAGWRAGSYVWNDEQTEAFLEPAGSDFIVNYGGVSQQWSVPDERSCFRCHNAAAGPVLGMTTAQANRPVDVDGRTVPQLLELRRRGVLENVPPDHDALARLVDPDDAAAGLDARARSWLHVNCAVCHQPGGGGSPRLDLRARTPFPETGLLRFVGRMGAPAGARAHAGLLDRLTTVGERRMPPLGSTVPDDGAVELLASWLDHLLR